MLSITTLPAQATPHGPLIRLVLSSIAVIILKRLPAYDNSKNSCFIFLIPLKKHQSRIKQGNHNSVSDFKFQITNYNLMVVLVSCNLLQFLPVHYFMHLFSDIPRLRWQLNPQPFKVKAWIPLKSLAVKDFISSPCLQFKCNIEKILASTDMKCQPCQKKLASPHHV